jgi:tRNA pseudouridine55 synthase
VNGFLCIDKPTGITSRDVVNEIQRHLRPAKVGHAGTLDPLATGVLVVAVGRATKLVSYVQRLEKRYTATFELGKTSDTEDISGQITKRDVPTPPSEESVVVACARHVGDILQRPPAYSAIRVNGKRAYDLARQGEKVELKERPVVIHNIDLLEYQFPYLKLNVCCGSGTYIRSLGRDIGEALGCGALMTELRRTAIGGFGIERSETISQMDGVDSIRSHLAPLVAGVATLPRLTVDKSQETAISYGKKITLHRQEDELAAISEEGELVAVLLRSRHDLYRPAINFIAH